MLGRTPEEKRHTQGPCACVTSDERVCRGDVCKKKKLSSFVWRVKHRVKSRALNCTRGRFVRLFGSVSTSTVVCVLCAGTHRKLVITTIYIFFLKRATCLFHTKEYTCENVCTYKGVPNNDVLLWPAWLLFCRDVFFPAIVCACEKHYAQSSYRNHVLFLDDFSPECEVVLSSFGSMPN